MSGPGHNRGPSMEPGQGFRRTAWARARRALLPDVPLEILRRRVARAEALGLPYKRYAAIRAATGEDIEALLFSTNALSLLRPADAIPPRTAAKLARVEAPRHAIKTARIRALQLASPPFKSIRPAPPFSATWSALGIEMRTWLQAERLPGDRVVMIGDTAFEYEHAAAGRLAAFVAARQYFEDARP